MNYKVFYPRLFLIIGTILAYFSSRVGSLIIDYSILLIIIFSLKKNNKKNNYIYILNIIFFFLMLPTIIGIISGEFNFYQWFRLVIRLLPFLISIYFISNKSSYEINKISKNNLFTLKIYTILLAFNSLIIYLSNSYIYPIPLYIDISPTLNTGIEGIARYYPLGYCLIIGSIGIGFVKRDFIWIISCLILGILTRGRSIFILLLISGIVSYFEIFFEKIKHLKIRKNLLSILITLFIVNITFFPWSRFSGKYLFEFADENSTRNIIASDAVFKTWSDKQSRFLGLGFGTESNLGYSFANPLGIEDDISKKLEKNAKSDVETFWGMYFSRFGILGILLLLYIYRRIKTNILKFSFFLYILLYGLASGIIADPSAGGYILMLFFNKQLLDHNKLIKS